MKTSIEPGYQCGSHDGWRWGRYAIRLPLLSLHLLIAVPLALAVFNPVSRHLRFRSERLDHRAIRWWSSALLRRFGFRIRAYGTPLPGPVMYVANHISWLDIVLMHSQRAMHFVAKSEIAGWPMVGWLAARSGTIFHRRGNPHSLTAVMQCVVERLRTGHPVGMFPEGGTGTGECVHTFHARVFQTALDADVPVQPVALRYGHEGRQDLSVPFGTDESFAANFFRLLGAPSKDAEIHFLQPVEHTPDARRRMAEESRQRIAHALGFDDV